MITVLVIDKDKNTIVLNLWEYEYRQIFKDKIDTKKIKRHKTLPELDKEVREYLKLDIFKKGGKNNEKI